MSLSLASVTADSRQYRTGYAAACCKPSSRSPVPLDCAQISRPIGPPISTGGFASPGCPRFRTLLAAFLGIAMRQGGASRMKKVIATIALAISLVPSTTMAQERGGDAALWRIVWRHRVRARRRGGRSARRLYGRTVDCTFVGPQAIGHRPPRPEIRQAGDAGFACRRPGCGGKSCAGKSGRRAGATTASESGFQRSAGAELWSEACRGCPVL